MSFPSFLFFIYLSMAVLLPVEEPFVAGTAIGCPRAFSVRLVSSLSISSRMARVSSSTSAAVRLVVGMGAKTVVGVSMFFFPFGLYDWRGIYVSVPLMGILPELKTRFLT